MHVLVTHLKQTSIFEWCAVRYGSKNMHQQDTMCSIEIGLCAQYLSTIPRINSQHNWRGGVRERCDHLMSKRISTLIMIKSFIQASRITKKMSTNTI
jgi:hypothetical protein